MGQIDTLPPEKNPAISKRGCSKGFIDAQYKPGQSGNPSGRPAKPLTERLLKRLADENDDLAGALVSALINRAQDGDLKTAGASVRAITEIFDRVEGKVAQKVEMNANVLHGVDNDQLESRLESLLAKRSEPKELPAVVETSEDGTNTR